MKPDRQTRPGAIALRLSTGNAPVGPTGTIGVWADKINTLWGRGSSSTLELARVVWTARRQLPYGAWTQLWQSGGVRFSKRKGDMLATIGKQCEELDAQTSAHLPAGWNILYHLALLDLPVIQRHIKAGVIHPGLKLREAKQLVAEFRGKPARNQSPKLNVRQRLKKFQQFIGATLKDWSVAERKLAAGQLKKLSEKISAGDKSSGGFHSRRKSLRIAPRFQMVLATQNSV